MRSEVVLPLRQHIGLSGTALVAEGEHVRKGQLMAECQGLGALLHAPFYGVVRQICQTHILLEKDAEQPQAFEPLPAGLGIAESARLAGLVGMGGAGFPSHIKLMTDLNGQGVLLANGVECEPLLAHNILQLTDEPALVRRGILLAMEATRAAKGILAIKSKNKAAIAAFRATMSPGDHIDVYELPDLYPMGEERAIIREVLGVLLGPEQLPSDAGAVVMNVETLSRLAEAVDLRRPVISKHVTLVGALGQGTQPVVFRDVPLGTPVAELITRAGGVADHHGRSLCGEIIIGGPFTGLPAAPDAVVTKTTGGVIVTMEFPVESRPIGLLVCACGAGEARLRDLAAKMHAPVAGVQRCKQAREGRGGLLRCENPGNCPGQAEKIMELRKAGAQALLVSNCSDCTNTVMCVAPKLRMPVYHATDHIMRTVGHSLVRRLPITK